MAPIPPKITQKPKRAQTQTVSTDNVIDDLGRTLTFLHGRQRTLDRRQDKDTTIARQHAAQSDADTKLRLIYRDVFPGQKYKLSFNKYSWIGGSDTVTIGYTVGSDFTTLFVISEPPESGAVEISLEDVEEIDTLEAHLSGAPEGVRGYLEDTTEVGSIKKAIIEILEKIRDLISGQETINQKISDIQGDISDLDDRVTALEDKE